MTTWKWLGAIILAIAGLSVVVGGAILVTSVGFIIGAAAFVITLIYVTAKLIIALASYIYHTRKPKK